LTISKRPFKVIKQGPDEITSQWDASLNGAVSGSEMCSQIIRAEFVRHVSFFVGSCGITCAETFTLEYSADRDEAARLLKRLIELGLPVAGFTPHRPDLEEAYLRTGIRQVD
jgi:hypothetical protein